MEKTRTLPPLVRGRVTGALDFFVDKISVKNTALLLNTFDLVLQVQWWGEDLPTYIWPKKSCYGQRKIHKNYKSVEMHFQCARYEIRTSLDLFESYLKTCEVLELCVLDSVRNCIIGSSFLRGLVNFLDSENNLFTVPIFDYLGEEIGDVSVSFRFLDMCQQKNVKKHTETIYSNKNRYNGKLDMNMKNFNIREKTKQSYCTPIENSFFYGRNEKINFEDIPAGRVSPERYVSQKNKKMDYINFGHDDMISIVSRNTEEMNLSDKKVAESDTYCYKCLPEITTSSDSSKILYFGLSSQESKRNLYNDNFKIGVANKFNSNSKKCKSKSKSKEVSNFLSDHNLYDGKLVEEQISQAVFNSCQKKAIKVQNVKQISSEGKSLKSEEIPNYYQTTPDDIPSKDSTKTKVMDFLLGSDLSKEEEESAVSELKKMSPSHNLVASINHLCITSDSDSYKSGNRFMQGRYSNFLAFPQQWSGLNFNFNDPIERKYYEMFFLKVNSLPELELAEILNQPENRGALEKLKSKESVCNKGSSQSSRFNNSKFTDQINLEKSKGKETSPEQYNNINKRVKGCAQCKYYKKLDELDTIIKSLKHFEKKMLLHDKDMEFLTEN